MSLQFVFGPSGGGKSYYLYEKIIEEAKKDRTKDFLLIVPEQFTMQTQKELVERSKNHAIMNIDVLSFERLAFRVFDELGMYQIRILEETGKNLILRRLTEEYGDSMSVLGSNLKKMGYVSEIKSLISEFMQYQITPEDIEAWCEDEDNAWSFRLKMKDILVIYRKFLEYLEGSYITSEEVLEECAKTAGRSVMLKDCNLIFDGFTGFTPVQVNLLKTLFPMTDRVWAAVTLDKRVDPFCVTGIQELFHMSQKMVRTLLELADEAKCEVLEPIWVEDGRQYRYGNAKALLHLEENLFRSSLKAYPKEQEEIQIQSCQNRKEELEFAAATISRMVREEDYRYRDFAIVSGAAADYANYVKEIFEAYGIPYFIDEKKTILFHPFIEFLRASLEMVEEDFSYESVMRYFRSGLSRQSTDEKVAYVISFIDELNITTSSSGALSDGPLRLTEKNNNVPTEKIWNDWKAYVVNARALYDTLDDQQKAQVTNTASLEKAEGYIYQLKADALKAMLKALPDAQTVRGYEAPQPTTVPSAQEAASVEEEQAVPAQSEGSDFSDGSADAFSSDEVDEQAAETVDIPQAESAEDTEDVQTDVDFSSDEEVPAAGDTSKRELTEAELKQIAEAKNAYDRLTETEEKKFRSENTALVENMEKLLAMALTYEKGQSAYQQFFADEAAQIYATVKDHPVDRDSYADVKAFLDRYAKDYQGQEDAMAGLKVKVGSQEMTFAEVIAALTAQADKAGKDISDAQQADEWISNLPTAVTKENIANVEAELAALQKLIDGMSVEGKSYMWNAKQLGLIKTIVADYHIELAGKQGAFKADMPADLQTKAINYKTVQISWSSVDNADGYMVYRRTADSGWKKIASRVTDISYKDQKAVTGTTYYYTVKAYSYAWGEMTVSSYDKDGVAGKARLGKVKIATANSESYSTIRVTWNKVSGANGYRVYRSTSKDGKYTAIGSTAKNSAVTFLDKKAVTGKTYYYKVRAYRNVSGKKVYGSYSATEKAKAVLSAPTLSAGSTSKTAVLEWSKVKGADGYQVYASDSQNGTYTRIKITKGTGATDESLLTGKTRYYKVRAYRKVNGKAVYGSFSKIKKVTVK